jgi:glycerate 2-kinase
MALRILVAPSGFKESLDSDQVADCIEAGVLRAMPDAKIIKAPLVDGGEGFTKALVRATGGVLHELQVTGPVGKPVASHFGVLGGDGPKTAVLEMAAAAGLRLVPRNKRNPLKTSTFGVGELIRAALDLGVERILIGCGDSGTNDGGAGMAQALGVQLLDKKGAPLKRGGSRLRHLAKIDLSGLDPRVRNVQIDVACNWHNILCGPKGVARVFGPQKGATPKQVDRLETALDTFAAVIQHDLGLDVHQMAGGGASGGLGAGLFAFLGAALHPRYDIVMQYLEFDKLLDEVDLVITAEGALDFQTPYGKVPAEVAMRAKRRNLPVIALAGTLGKGAEDNYAHGIDAFTSILEAPCELQHAIQNAVDYLTRATERLVRTMLIGQQLIAEVPALPVPAFSRIELLRGNFKSALNRLAANL